MNKTNHVVRIIIAAAALTLFAIAGTPANGAELKFRAAPGQEPVIGRYLVTLDDSVDAEHPRGKLGVVSGKST